MAEKNNFNANVDALFRGMDSFVTTKTVVGEAKNLGDVTIVPLADVSFGVGAGEGGGGLGGKISPTAVLIIGKDGSTRMVRTDEKEDMVSKIISMAPGIISKFTNKNAGPSDADSAVDEVLETMEEAAEVTADAILDGEKK